MGTLIESYNQIFNKVKSYQDRIAELEELIRVKSEDTSANVLERIEKLEEQLVKIDDYLLRIKGFQELAKKNLDSQNVLTIEAPPGYRVNLNRLRNWAMMIDPMSSNDPYAQRVYLVAKCDEHFLEKKQVEFQERIEELKHSHDLTGTNEEIEGLKKNLQDIKAELKKYAMSDELSDLSRLVVDENEKNWHKNAPDAFHNPEEASESISPGAYAASLNFEKESRIWLKNAMGDFYDTEKGRVQIPVKISNNKEFVMMVNCSPARRKELDRAIQNFALSSIMASPAGSRKLFIIDGVRFSTASMGSLRQLEGSFCMEQIPRNPDQLTALLEQMVSSFADMDETIELYDSVAEYNAAVEASKRLPYSTVFLFGWPTAYEGHDRELIMRMLTNYERYGLSFVIISYSGAEKKDSKIPEYALQNAIHINTLKNETTITFSDGSPQSFLWYTFEKELPASFVDTLKGHEIAKNVIGNEYTKRYSLVNIPPYERDYKKLELPFGIDGKDQPHSLSFENENFATYLVGASRSGKSTLLHTLIAGLIRNYHPDNVELWLADFKQLEFKRYIKHLPPHVKYVLLDESTELVFNLIDKLTAVMMERQKLFARLGVQRIDQVAPQTLDDPLPLIVVILDEFSIMSQSIADSPIYKLRLQNILAKGAALGIRFLFSSQTFTTGVAGLTPTARAQIQQRISMKGSKEEISETLELSTNLKTEQVRNWMDALPPHYALVKFRQGADSLPQVKRYLVMYFEDYAPRDEMIDSIRSFMKPVDNYCPSDINSYVDKHPVTVDGNSFDIFSAKVFQDSVSELKRTQGADLNGDELYVSFGTPRLMERIKLSALTDETRENLLLIARSAEQACAASIILSVIKSALLQNAGVEIWAYGKNRLYHTYKQQFVECGVEIAEGIDAVCDRIRALKKAIRNKEYSKKIVILIGMDRICMDFDYIAEDYGVKSDASAKNSITQIKKEFEKNGAMVSSDYDKKKVEYARAWIKRKKEFLEENDFSDKTEDEKRQLLREEDLRYREETGFAEVERLYQAEQNAENGSDDNAAVVHSDVQESIKTSEQPAGEPGTGAYNASDDFVDIIKQGSRLGLHFFMELSSFADLKQCGLKPVFFRHKLGFQMSVEDSRDLFTTKIASTLPEHICQYDDSLEMYSFRPYLHAGVGWEGWFVDDNGEVVSPYEEAGD